jgi:hypothetical protein
MSAEDDLKLSFELDAEDPVELTLEDEPEELQLTLEDENQNFELTLQEPETLELSIEDNVPTVQPEIQNQTSEVDAELELTLNDEPDELELTLEDMEPEIQLEPVVETTEPKVEVTELTFGEDDEEIYLTFDEEEPFGGTGDVLNLELEFKDDNEDEDELELTFSETDEDVDLDAVELQLTFDEEGDNDNVVELELNFDEEEPQEELFFSDEIPEISLSMGGNTELERTVSGEEEPDPSQFFSESDMLMMNFDEVDPELRSFFEVKKEEQEVGEDGEVIVKEPEIVEEEEEPKILKTGVKKTGNVVKDKLLERCNTSLRNKIHTTVEYFSVDISTKPLKNTPFGQEFLYFNVSAFNDGDWSVIGQTEKIK